MVARSQKEKIKKKEKKKPEGNNSLNSKVETLFFILFFWVRDLGKIGI